MLVNDYPVPHTRVVAPVEHVYHTLPGPGRTAPFDDAIPVTDYLPVCCAFRLLVTMGPVSAFHLFDSGYVGWITPRLIAMRLPVPRFGYRVLASGYDIFTFGHARSVERSIPLVTVAYVAFPRWLQFTSGLEFGYA